LVTRDGGSRQTNAAGTATLDFAHLPQTFTVAVQGGRALGRALDGSMSVQVHGYRTGRPVRGVTAGPVVHVNPVTTLVDILQQDDRHVGETRAQRLIDHALQIPGWVDGITLGVDNQWLDGRLFLKDIRTSGSLDRATESLVAKIRHHRHVASLRPLRAARAAGLGEWWEQTDISGLVKDGLTALGQGVAQGIGSAGGTWILAKFFEAIGLGKVADVLCPTCHIEAQLDAIAAQVALVKNLVEQGIQATEQSHYDQLVASVASLDGDISQLWENMRYESTMKNDPDLKGYNEYLLGNIEAQLVTGHSAISDLNAALSPSAPGASGILQAASEYLGSRLPFFTQGSSKTMQAVFDYYQLMQLRLSVLLTNYYSTLPKAFSPKTIKDTVIDKITNNLAGQQTLMKPPLPPGTFIDLRTDRNGGELLLWGPVTWVNGLTLEHYCVDGQGVRHRFYVNSALLNCDPPGHDSARLGYKLATEAQFKALLNGWKGKTPLAWLQNETGLGVTAAPKGSAESHAGFFWVGRKGPVPNQDGPVAGPYCRSVCFDDNTLGMYEYLYRYDMQDKSTPSPDEWATSLFDLDPWNYNSNAILVQTVKPGTYFYPPGGG
jgi:hypothetical protein